MRRIVLGIAILATAAVAVFVTLLARAPLDDAGVAMLDALRDGSGLRVEVNGRTKLSMFPTPQVRMAGVSFAQGDQEPFAIARELIGSPRMSALLFGRLELSDVTLDGAQIALDRIPVGALFSTGVTPARAWTAPSIRIVDGRLAWGGQAVEKVEAGLVWAGAGRPLSASGYGTFADRPVEATFALTDPEALARHEQAPFRVRIEGGGARVTFDGTAIDDGGVRFTGDLSARAASLRETLRWIGAPAPRRSSPLTGFSLVGRATADKSGLSIADAELNLEGGSFLGAGRIAVVSGQPSIEATLDTGRLDLDPYVNGIAPALQEEHGWNPRPVDLKLLAGYDLDLRLSAGEVRSGALRLGPIAATVVIAGGAFDLAVGEASAYDGTVGGHLSVSPEGAAGARVRLQTELTGIDLDEALRRFVTQPPLTGALTANISVEGVGVSAADVIATLKGEGEARVTGGSLEGIGRSRTLSLAGLRGGMDIASAEATLRIDHGVARTSDFAIMGSDATFTLSGEARLVDRDLRLQGFVKPKEGAWTLPVRVDGPLSSPKLRPYLSSATDPHAEADRRHSATPGG
ncbi:AsmA family protein [Hansschlegelia plantiphila]|uniref:Cell envelope biogenesis protein AsmA n=1 Tax=Hansschlegelia plantiphila TaxID=374655 RepID=A0A9W6J0L2_9HYPH|nr:AsmA-like C-terminal region-containing protein [Hansschlegelia plantiphila]GLK68596.1 cell envelope biogenesis protein AsmA [Hansschlegelia plantiphila]